MGCVDNNSGFVNEPPVTIHAGDAELRFAFGMNEPPTPSAWHHSTPVRKLKKENEIPGLSLRQIDAAIGIE